MKYNKKTLAIIPLSLLLVAIFSCGGVDGTDGGQLATLSFLSIDGENPLLFTCIPGAVASSKMIKVTNSGEADFVLSYASDVEWITLDPASSTIKAGSDLNVTVNVDCSSLTIGSYNKTILLKTDDYRIQTAAVGISITVTETEALPIILVQPSSLDLNCIEGEILSADLFISNGGGGGEFYWSATHSDTNWVELLNGGFTPSVLTVIVKCSLLTANNDYADTIIIYDYANNLSQSVALVVHVHEPSAVLTDVYPQRDVYMIKNLLNNTYSLGSENSSVLLAGPNPYSFSEFRTFIKFDVVSDLSAFSQAKLHLHQSDSYGDIYGDDLPTMKLRVFNYDFGDLDESDWERTDYVVDMVIDPCGPKVFGVTHVCDYTFDLKPYLASGINFIMIKDNDSESGALRYYFSSSENGDTNLAPHIELIP